MSFFYFINQLEKQNETYSEVQMKKIMILSTGGTISAYHENRLDFRNYQSGYYSGDYILEQIPEVHQYVDVDVEQIANLSSTLINTEHWLILREKINTYLNKDHYDGVVITHGTNTIEETAYFLNLTVNTNKPIVITGAQRPLSALSSDAPINLLNAVKVAASDTSYGKGVLVVLNDQISGARAVTKTNTYRLETFQSIEQGYLGFIDPDDKIVFYQSPVRKHTYLSEFSIMKFKKLPEVDIVYSYAGANGKVIRSLIESGVKGIVVAGTGAGRCSYEEEKALEEAAKQGIKIVMSSRYGNGRVVPLEKYDYLNVITADNLPPHKARILLMVALAKYNEQDRIQDVFHIY
ncbi:asparaginase [Ornithinibacillus sp. 4-3]|uniref:asparaginase n=1 Tax=Ornithinibacillus sp. 4-3 TaxID=3231488 RepID=A0AB39HJ78_9BACI